jgi:hypothetical protein
LDDGAYIVHHQPSPLQQHNNTYHYFQSSTTPPQTNLSRVKSTPHINHNHNGTHNNVTNVLTTTNQNTALNQAKLNASQRTKSENELANLNESSYRLRTKQQQQMAGSSSRYLPNRVVVAAPLPPTKLIKEASKEESDPVSNPVSKKEQTDEFKIVFPNAGATYHTPRANNVSKIGHHHFLLNVSSNSPIELCEPSPYNIMSDPVICEQFRKLYEEDEYFQNVHKKCVEWLSKYVFAAEYD